jgi:hypothetical protein
MAEERATFRQTICRDCGRFGDPFEIVHKRSCAARVLTRFGLVRPFHTLTNLRVKEERGNEDIRTANGVSRK